MSQYVIYGLLCLVLSIFHEETLGDTEALYIVTEKLLKRGFIAEDFWNKVIFFCKYHIKSKTRHDFLRRDI